MMGIGLFEGSLARLSKVATASAPVRLETVRGVDDWDERLQAAVAVRPAVASALLLAESDLLSLLGFSRYGWRYGRASETPELAGSVVVR
jgi:hypothetical protein